MKNNNIKDYAMYRLNLVNGFISLADTKNSIGLTLSTILVTLITGYGLEKLVEYIKENKFDCFSIFISLLYLVTISTLFVSIYFYSKSLIPQKDSTDNQKTKSKNIYQKFNTFYYRHISKLDINTFINHALKTNDVENVREILEEVYFNSAICDRKMENFRTGIIYSLISILFSLISLVILIFL